MTVDHKNSNHLNKKSLKETLNNVWNYLNNKWIWINIVLSLILLAINWVGVYYTFIPLEIALLITLLYPAVILTVYVIHKSKFERSFNKILFSIVAALALGFPIWLALVYFLITAPWAPFYKI